MTRLALAHYAAAALFVLPILAHATGLDPRGVVDAIVVPPGDPRLLGLGTGATGGILTPTPPLQDGCSFWSGCDALEPETIPAIPLPAPVWLLAGAVGVLAMMKRRRK